MRSFLTTLFGLGEPAASCSKIIKSGELLLDSDRLRTLLTNSVLLISSSSVRISSYESDEDDEQLLSSEEMISHVLDDLGNGGIGVHRSGLS